MRLALAIFVLLLAVPGLQAQEAVKQCIERHPVGVARADCLAPWLEEIVRAEGAGRALQAAESVVKSGAMNDCHVMAHAIGHASWRKARSLGPAFRGCTDACIQGCMHGVIEASMMPAAGTELGVERVLGFCDSLGKGSIERRQCLHGLGHGIMHQHRADLAAAMAGCDGLGGRFEREQCFGGLWMQWAHFPVREGASGFRARAVTLCASVRTDLLGRCAHAVGGAAMFATGHDAALSRSICSALPPAQRGECNRGVQYEIDVLREEGVHAHQH